MTKEQEQAFEGRWRFKSECLEDSHMYVHYNINGVIQSLYDHVKDLCRDFFEAGIELASFPVSGGSMVTIAPVSDGSPSEQSFEQFWKLYDKRIARSKCEKLWSKLTQKEKQDCIAYVPLYKQAQPDKQFRKNPETFLRNKSFYDEIINRNTEDQQRVNRFQQAARVIASYDSET